jgi:hypothetical protein
MGGWRIDHLGEKRKRGPEREDQAGGSVAGRLFGDREEARQGTFSRDGLSGCLSCLLGTVYS